MSKMSDIIIKAIDKARRLGIDPQPMSDMSLSDLLAWNAEDGLPPTVDGHNPGDTSGAIVPPMPAAPRGDDIDKAAPGPARKYQHHDGSIARPETAEAPTIEVKGGALAKNTTAAEEAILYSGIPIFQRGPHLVRPILQDVPTSKGRRTVAAGFSEISCAGARDIMARSALWVKYDSKKRRMTACDPPRAVAETLLSRHGEWRFLRVSGIITTPTMRPDFSILRELGYDPATRFYLMEDGSLVMPEIPDRPTRDQAMAALTLIDDLLVNFPFVTNSDRSVALSAILTAVCRGAMPVAPLHAFRAPTAGTGKSFLIDVASAIATGRPAPVMSAGRDMDEMDKRLTGHLLAGYSIILIDNLNGALGSDLLCQATERPLLRVRRLGGSEIYEIESNSTLFVNGNGFSVASDMTRRTVICDLDAEMERPELRRFDFDPVERVLSDRGAYVAAALTVVRAFVMSGDRPDILPLASYADYTATVRGALVWLGHPDPALSMERAREDDPDLASLRAVMGQWIHHVGLGVESSGKAVAGLADLHRQDGYGRILPEYIYSDLRDALMAVAPGRQGIDTTRLGRWLRAKSGRVVMMTLHDGRRERVRFEQGGITEGSMRWKLAAIPSR